MRLSFYFLFGLMALGLFFSSCGSDDESVDGTYKMLSFTTTNCADPDENISFDFSANDGCVTIAGVEVCGQGTLTLNTDNTFSYSFTLSGAGLSETSNGSGTYSVDGNQITICDGDECSTSTFSLGSNMITISLSEADDPCVITIRGEKV